MLVTANFREGAVERGAEGRLLRGLGLDRRRVLARLIGGGIACWLGRWLAAFARRLLHGHGHLAHEVAIASSQQRWQRLGDGVELRLDPFNVLLGKIAEYVIMYLALFAGMADTEAYAYEFECAQMIFDAF